MTETQIQVPIQDGNNITVITLPSSALSLQDGQEIVYVQLEQPVEDVESVVKTLGYQEVLSYDISGNSIKEEHPISANYDQDDFSKFEYQEVTSDDILKKMNLPSKRGRKPKTGDDLKCDICGKEYTKLKMLTQHKKYHSDERPHKCTVVGCGKPFKTSGALTRHMRTHTNFRPYKCHYCEMRFTQTGARKHHELTHTGDKPHKCNVCGAAFIQLGSLQNHLIVHTNERSHECEECGATYKHRKALLRHMKVHNSTKDFQCIYCWRSYYERYDLKRHLTVCKYKNNPKQKNSECTFATEKDKNSSNLENSLTSHLGTCSSHNVTKLKQINSDGAAVEYDKSHEYVSPISCKICSKEFTNKATLQQHFSRFHLKPNGGFLCEFCGQKFHTKPLLDIHVKVHFGDNPHTCTNCDRKFMSLSELNKHARVHFDTKPFSCKICKRSFKLHKALQHHMFTHVSDSPFNCEYCGRPCGDRTTKVVHYKQHVPQIFMKLGLDTKHCQKPADYIKYLHFILKKERNLLEDSKYSCSGPVENTTISNEMVEGMFREIVNIVGTGKKIFNTPVTMKDLPDLGFEAEDIKNHVKESNFRKKKQTKCNFIGCNRVFRTAAILTRHKLIHANTRPYKCKFCDKQFTQSGSCKIHERIHTGDRPYKCKLCDASFTQLGSLKLHLFRHSNNRNQTCDICGAKFKVKKALLRHMKIHKCSKKFLCNFCGNDYFEKYDAKCHVRRCQLNSHKICTDEDIIEVVVESTEDNSEPKGEISELQGEISEPKGQISEPQGEISDTKHDSSTLDDFLVSENVTNIRVVEVMKCTEDKDFMGAHDEIQKRTLRERSKKRNLEHNKETTFADNKLTPRKRSKIDIKVQNDCVSSERRSKDVCSKEADCQDNRVDCSMGSNLLNEKEGTKCKEDNQHRDVKKSCTVGENRIVNTEMNETDREKENNLMNFGNLPAISDKGEITDNYETGAIPETKLLVDSSTNESMTGIKEDTIENHLKLIEQQKDIHFVSKDVNSFQKRTRSRSVGKCYSCSKCNREFYLEHLHDDHRSKCKGKQLNSPCKSFKCEICSEQFKTLALCRDHLKSHDQIKCGLCNQTFKTYNARKRHMNQVHVEKNKFSCLFCKKSFHELKLLKNHEGSHSENTKYKCEFCENGDIYKGKENYIHHIDHCHPMIRPFRCSGCMIGFKSQAEAKDHKLTSGCTGSVLKLSAVD